LKDQFDDIRLAKVARKIYGVDFSCHFCNKIVDLSPPMVANVVFTEMPESYLRQCDHRIILVNCFFYKQPIWFCFPPQNSCCQIFRPSNRHKA